MVLWTKRKELSLRFVFYAVAAGENALVKAG